MSKNLFETYEVNGRQYTDNLPPNSFISISKKQYIEYEQQKEEIERLNNIINKAIEYMKEHSEFIHVKDFNNKYIDLLEMKDVTDVINILQGSNKE